MHVALLSTRIPSSRCAALARLVSKARLISHKLFNVGQFARSTYPCGALLVHRVSVSVPPYNGRSCGLREVFILFSCSRSFSYDMFSYKPVVTTTHTGNT